MRPFQMVSWLFFAGCFVSCGPQFQPRHSLQEVRVLSLEANPLEVGLAEVVEVTPRIHVPLNRTITSFQWHFCPLSSGSWGGYTCLVESCDVKLESPAYDTAVTVNPGDELMSCVRKIAEQERGSAGEVAMDPTQMMTIDTHLHYEWEDDTGRKGRSVKAIALWREKPEETNRSPGVLDVFVNGVAFSDIVNLEAVRHEDIEVAVHVDATTMDTYEDSRGTLKVEEAVVSFYSTAGSFRADWKSGLQVVNTLAFKAPATARTPWEPPLALDENVSELSMYVVVRDGRGGQTTRGPIAVSLRTP